MKTVFSCLLSLVLGWTLFAQERLRTCVTVTSQPEGASIIIDGVDKGTTPRHLFDLEPGRHHLKYRLAGYEEVDRFFDMGEGPRIEKNEALEEVKGVLLLKTDPEGCDIQVDGVSVGRTPRLVTHLAAKGTYTVKLRKSGYLDQVISVKFDGRKPLVREEKMVLASGTVEIQSDPAGAEVVVNGVTKGQTPLTVSEVPKGRAVIKFLLDGYSEEVRELAINAGDHQTLSVALNSLPGTLQLSSVPSGARMYVNDEPRGTTPMTLSGLKPGDYEVRAELEGYGTVTRTVTIGNGKSVNEEFRLSNVMGRLEIRTNPHDVQVILDGRNVGTTHSKDPEAEFSDILSIENVLEGEHVLMLKRDGYADLTRHPKVQNSQTTKLHHMRLSRIFTPNVEIVTSRTSCKGVLLDIKPDYIEIESSPGIKRSFPRAEVREIKHLDADK